MVLANRIKDTIESEVTQLLFEKEHHCLQFSIIKKPLNMRLFLSQTEANFHNVFECGVKFSQECFQMGKNQDRIPDLGLVYSNFILKSALRGTANLRLLLDNNKVHHSYPTPQ